tara:strand:+ start:8271 stop:9365 length:1095 start_codon:yes stop_codon:yes gene_type:complete
MNSSLSLLLLLFAFSLSGQDCNLENAVVNAPSGLILREQVAKGFITTIPFGDTINYCSDKSFGRAEYEGIKGDWRKVYFKKKEGYMFDGFLRKIVKERVDLDSLRSRSAEIAAQTDSLLGNTPGETTGAVAKPNYAHPYLKSDELQLAIESYNFCGDIQSLDPTLYWYAIFLQSETDPTGQHRIVPVDLKLILSKEKVGSGLEFDILTDKEERSLFLIGSNKVIPYQDISLYDQSEAMRMRGSKLFPGQELSLDDERKVKLSATGQVVKAGDCPELKDYKITISYQNEGISLEQDLSEIIPDFGDCQIPRLYWYGDISGDGLSDIIYVSVFENKNVFTLLQSVANPSKELFTQKAVFTLTNCQK